MYENKVMADANLDTLIDWAMIGCFFCAGQVCSATSRLIVDESIVDELIAKLVEAAHTKIIMGDSLDESTTMGPLISADQQHKVSGYVDRAMMDDRCEALLNPDTWQSHDKKGYFVKPQIFRVRPHNKSDSKWPEVWREEVFGPVLCISTFKSNDVQEAVQMANDSPYGLGHAVMGSNPEAVRKLSKKLRAGVVWENCSQPLYPNTPFGGCKQSGFGREYGELGLEEFVHHKTIISAGSNHGWNWYG
jgi:betaine-aldehyde dehydrogenase